MTRLSTPLMFAVLLTACAGELEEDLDPAGSLGDEEWSDEGPLPADEASDAEQAAADPTTLEGPPRFQLPFPCGQVWAGQTRTNHSPQNSIDFNRTDDLGDKVVASAGGTVTRVENLGNTSYGRWIEIAHGGGYTTRYAHLASQSVVTGQTVAQGQKIGTVGNTGGSSGPHLHYEQRRYGSAVRPTFDGRNALFFGTKNYTSQNKCGAPAGAVTGRVNTAGPDLTIRRGASTSTEAIGSVADGATVTLTCQKLGQEITGTYGTTRLWDKIGTGFVSDAYVSTGSDGQVAPTCP